MFSPRVGWGVVSFLFLSFLFTFFPFWIAVFAFYPLFKAINDFFLSLKPAPHRKRRYMWERKKAKKGISLSHKPAFTTNEFLLIKVI